MRFPVNQPYQITTYFNPSTHPGIDIAPLPGGMQGVGCYAPENSSVYTAGYVASLEGNFVILRGDSGVYYYFGHFANQMMSKGQRVNEGQQIGVLGQTGQATGIHTHHEVRPNGPGPGSSIDPLVYYKDNQGEDVATDAQIDEAIAIAHQAAFGTPAPDVDFQNLRPLLKNNYVDGVAEMLKQYNDNPEVAWRHKGDSQAEILKPGTYKVN